MANKPFIKPIEAPIFSPTEEEFKNPLDYLNKIRPLAEKHGICKVKPPPNWQPPFAVDVDSFKFTPRVQRLNELEARTRIKLNFLDRIAKFWELQGSSLKIPIIDKKALDLYNLHEWVRKEGGMEKVNAEKKWNRISLRMNYSQAKNYGNILKGHYEKFLYPFDLFEASKDKMKGSPMKCNTPKNSPAKATPKKVTPGTKMGGGGRMGGKPMMTFEEVEEEAGSGPKTVTPPGPVNTSNELKRLAFYGAGPKMAGFNSKSSQNLQLRMQQQQQQQQDGKGSPKGKLSAQDPMSKYMCQVCDRGDVEACMLLCDGCDDSYHTFCLEPPIADIPKGEWRCPKCVADEVSKPSEAFGFEQAQREYTLQQFGEMADQFKSEYFNMPVHLVSSEMVEAEFWRIVAAIDEDVTVEYGADLHTMDHGSGFPTLNGTNTWSAADQKYAKSGWNLNNLPVLPGSVLGHINTDISGMMVPWMYVGMCFATFCWHNEDHWSYSINYLHWGEAKTWYGVPGCKADEFETAMKKAAPELFLSQPDLLHQLVTIMNPNILMGLGVPVYRMDQKAGEFIITFPRAYHAGFNQGYNFAEAVNFAPADWLAMGRSCIEHYSTLHRYCVFSHDELVCKMTSEAEDLDIMIAMATYKDMLTMYEAEKEYRRVVLSWGVTECERVAFEVIADDAKLCDYCKTTCFLSAVTCSCSKDRLACLKHYDKLCECPPSSHVLKFRYTLDEIPVMMKRLRERTQEYEDWVRTLKEGVTHVPEQKIDLDELKELLSEAETKRYPKTALLDSAQKVLSKAEKCAEVAKKLANPAVRTRLRHNDETKYKVTIEELNLFVDEVESLSVRIKEAAPIRMLLEKIKTFKIRAKELLAEQVSKIDDLKACLNMGLGIDIELTEIPLLQSELDRNKWLHQVNQSVPNENQNVLWTVEFLTKTIEAGEKLDKHFEVEEQLNRLKEKVEQLNDWEKKAEGVLRSTEKVAMEEIKKIVNEANKTGIHLPSLPAIRDLFRKATEWLEKGQKYVESHFNYPFLDELEAHVSKGEGLPVILQEVEGYKKEIVACKGWKRNTSRLFLKKNTLITLIEALLPRIEIHTTPPRGKKVTYNPAQTLTRHDVEVMVKHMLARSDFKNTETLFEGLNRLAKQEKVQINNLREHNRNKRSTDDGNARYCVCHSYWHSGYMIQCQLCLDFFHTTCVPLPKYTQEPIAGITSLVMSVYLIAGRQVRFLCPCCCRSRRPTLDTLVGVMSTLQQLPVRLIEGECVEYLSNRAVKWLDTARSFLDTPGIYKRYQMLEPVGVVPLRDVPSSLRYAAANARSGCYGGGYAPVWRSHSGATLTEDLIVPGKLIEGPSGRAIWEDQKAKLCADYKVEMDDIMIRNVLATLPEEEAVEIKQERVSPIDPMLLSDEELCPSPTPSDTEAANALMTLASIMTQSKRSVPPSSAGGSSHVKGVTFEHGYCSTAPGSSRNGLNGSPKRGPLSEIIFLTGPNIPLTGARQQMIEELLLEASLMEVTFTEVRELYRLLEFSRPPVSVPSLSDLQEKIQIEVEFKDLPNKIKIKKEDKKARQENAVAAAAAAATSPQRLSLSVTNDRTGKKKTVGNRRSTGSGTVVRKRKASIEVDSAKKRTQSKRHQEYNEDCAAEKCRQPSGKEVNWVQCEFGCELWFHWICVGLRQDEVKKIGRYCCIKCKKPKLEKIESVDSCSKLSEAGPRVSSNKENKEKEEVGGGTGASVRFTDLRPYES